MAQTVGRQNAKVILKVTDMTISKIPTEPTSTASDEISPTTARRWIIYAVVVAFIIAASPLLWYAIFPPPSADCPPKCDYTRRYFPVNFEEELAESQVKWDGQHITHYQMS